MIARSLVVAVAAIAASACLFEDPDVGGVFAGTCDPADSDPAVSVSFGADIRPLLDRPGTEGGCGCHGPGGSGTTLSGFELSSLASIRRGGEISGSRIIVPGDPCNSILVQKMSPAPPFGARMPLAGPPFFSAAELQVVRDWIAEGAKDN